jgi:hypothetical protein
MKSADEDTMLYLEYQKVWVNGTLIQEIRWQNAATFTDLSLNGNNATPSFRTISSNANVVAVLNRFIPADEAKAPGYTLSSAPDFLSLNNPGGNFTTVLAPTFPGAAILIALSTASGTPAQLPFLILAMFLTLSIGFFITYLMRKSGVQSSFIKIAIISVCMIAGILTLIIDLWMFFIYLIFAVTVLLIGNR